MDQLERGAGFPSPITIQIPGKELCGQAHGYGSQKDWSSNSDCAIRLLCDFGPSQPL